MSKIKNETESLTGHVPCKLRTCPSPPAHHSSVGRASDCRWIQQKSECPWFDSEWWDLPAALRLINIFYLRCLLSDQVDHSQTSGMMLWKSCLFALSPCVEVDKIFLSQATLRSSFWSGWPQSNKGSWNDAVQIMPFRLISLFLHMPWPRTRLS